LQLKPGQGITAEQLQDLGRLFKAADSTQASKLKTLLGIRSIVKLVWIAGIVGICLTILPFAIIILEPILQQLAPLIRQIARIASNMGAVVYRLLRVLAMQAWPVCSWLLYFACFNLVAAAGSSDMLEVAAYVALTGHLLAITLTVREACWDFR
jgi:hypothetical protein